MSDRDLDRECFELTPPRVAKAMVVGVCVAFMAGLIVGILVGSGFRGR